MSAIVLDSVSRHFGPITAVDNVNLSVGQGELVTLLGPSGCGKTTTLRMVAGLEQNSEGQIKLGDRIVSDAKAGRFVPPERRALGMVFQSYAIWPHMSVFGNVAYPLRVRRWPKNEIREKVEEALKLVEMSSFIDRPAPALSGGQQQRVAIARALVSNPQVLLMDEPFSNLDARLRTQMGEDFRDLQRRLGITCLYVTHDQDEALILSDRIVVMHAGRILQIDSPENIYLRPVMPAIAAFFGAPNLCGARIVACRQQAEGRFQLAVEAENCKGDCLAGEPFNKSEPVTIMVRPESIRIHGPEENLQEGQLTWSGRVVDSVFRGSYRALVVAVGDERINVRAGIASAAAVGDTVKLSAPVELTWAMRAQRDIRDGDGA